MQWETTVVEAAKREGVTRLTFANGIVVYVPHAHFDAAVASRVRVQRTDDDAACADAHIVLSGEAYKRNDEHDFLSCGGFLARVPHSTGHLLALTQL